jgi:aryl-alcohol dehydrogenase-like predicted oxidoreductase
MLVRRRVLGRTGLSVSELGFGCAGFWANRLFPEHKAVVLLEHAIARGINVFDTGPSYAGGNAERRLGLLLRSVRDRSDLVVCSKIGTHAAENGRLYRDWSPDAIATSIRRSLDRLGIDRLDVVHLHNPDVPDLQPKLLETLSDLKREGLVRFFGINTRQLDIIRVALSTSLFDSFMIEYNVIRKGQGTLLSAAGAAGAGAVVIQPIARALYRPFRLPRSLKDLWELARVLRWRGGDVRAARRYRFLNDLPGATGPQWALAYVLSAQTFATAFFGTTSVEHLDMNLAAVQLTVPSDLLQRIEALPDA